jgi:hypothetical protein
MFTVISFGCLNIGAFKGKILKFAMAALVLPIMFQQYQLQYYHPGHLDTLLLYHGTGNNIYINCRYVYGYIFGLAKLVGAFKGLSPGEALISAGLMVLILPAMALSIALSSKALSMVEPISFAHF